MKNRKLHQLIGIVNSAWIGKVQSGQWKNNPFYVLKVVLNGLLKEETNIYVLSNLVSKELWNSLSQGTWKNKKLLFFCEKRKSGWRLKNYEEL